MDRQQGWAVGDHGTIWHTADGGRRWEAQKSGAPCDLRGLQFLDRQRGWVVGGWSLPYTNESRGVILSTEDGGQTWHAMPRVLLPKLEGVYFHDLRNGWAYGRSSSLYPSGLFRTANGGGRWDPVPPSTAGIGWRGGAFPSRGRGILISGGDRLGKMGGLTLEVSPAEFPKGKRIECLTMAADENPPIWLAGSSGLVMASFDGGDRWYAPESLPFEAGGFDFHAVACFGHHIWLAGSPGSIIFHSPDDGLTWQTLPTGQASPIRSLSFVDDSYGWALGSLGEILATEDGGRTWTARKNGDRRLACWAIVAKTPDIPVELIADISAARGYRMGVEVLTPSEAVTGSSLLANDLAAEAVARAGGSVTEIASSFALPATSNGLGRDEILAEWDAQNNGRGASRLLEHITRQIRIWRPDVIITHAGDDAEESPERWLLRQAVLEAVRRASDAQRYPDQLSAQKLSTWQVRRVWGIASDSNPRGLEVNSEYPSRELGQCLADFAVAPRGLLISTYTPSPKRITLSVLQENTSTGLPGENLLGGLDPPPGPDARRVSSVSDEAQIRGLKSSMESARTLRALLQTSERSGTSGHVWSGLGSLLNQLPQEVAGSVLFRLAQDRALESEWKLAADLMEYLVDRIPNHALSPACHAWLIQYYTSAELNLARPTSEPARRDQNAPDAPTVQGEPVFRIVGIDPITAAAPSQNGDERDTRLRERFQQLNQSDPMSLARSEIQFPLASWWRRTGQGELAKEVFARVALLKPSPWAERAAQGEAWLAEPVGPCPIPVWSCLHTDTKPYLDGDLDEPTWQSARTITWEWRALDSVATTTTARAMRDDEFLYVAVVCERAETAGSDTWMDAVPDSTPRTRDADLADEDHIEMSIDVDRDLTTSFLLSTDWRGRTHDAVWRSARWNPAWYVATAVTESDWTLEAAIPLRELTTGPPNKDDAWVVSIRRLTPNGRDSGWPANIDGADAATDFGYLRFE